MVPRLIHYLVHAGITFDPVQTLEELGHVTNMLASLKSRDHNSRAEIKVDQKRNDMHIICSIFNMHI